MEIQVAGNELRLLESKFTRAGHLFEKIEEGPTFFLYQVRREDAPRNWFEVFQRRVYKGREIEGKEIPPAEAYPNDNAFGVWAWTFERLDAARAKAFTIRPHSSTLPKAPAE